MFKRSKLASLYLIVHVGGLRFRSQSIIGTESI